MSKSLSAKKLSPKQTTQVLIGAGALILVIGGIILFLMNSKINDMQAAVSAKETQVGSNEQVAERYQQTLTQYNETLAHTQFLEASVSAKSFVPTLLKQLQDLATATHLTVNTVRPGQVAAPVPAAPKPADGDSGASTDVKKAPPPPYDTLDIQVDVTGSYANSAAFLYGLTQFPKIVSVTSAQMQPDAATTQPGGPPSVKTSLHLTAFVFHEDKDAATAPGATPAAPISTAYAPHPFPIRPVVGGTPSAVSDAAVHAAGSAIGASKSAQARSEVGIETL